MNLLIDPVSNPAVFVFFDDDRNVSHLCRKEIAGKEFETFLEALSDASTQAGTDVKNLGGIACVRWPAGFTGIRVVSLTLGTLATVWKIPLFELDAFELFAAAGMPFPAIIRANRDEYAYCKEPGAPFELVRKDLIPEGRYSGIALESDFAGRKIFVESEKDYAEAVKNLDLSSKVDRIDPLYLKKPHITPSACNPKT